MIIKSGRILSVEEIMDMQSDVNVSPALPNPISLEKEEKADKWYLPRLNINDPTMWESAPLEKRRHFTDQVALQTCLGNCCGVSGLKSACCILDPDDIEHVLGPLDEEWIKETIKWFQKQGIKAQRSDIVIDYDEGKLIGEKFFNGHEVFKAKTSYPMMRFQVAGPRFACKFLNVDNGKCTIYHKRPEMCRKYYCSYLKSNFLLKLSDKPNTWQKLR